MGMCLYDPEASAVAPTSMARCDLGAILRSARG
jgi:hypothetical protein